MNKKSKLWIRIMAWILSGLMVVGGAYFAIAAIVESVHEAQAEKEQSQEQHTEDDGHDHEGHNH